MSTPRCKNFNSSKGCPFGEKCKYTHPTLKCRHFKSGKCHLGEKCTFSHKPSYNIPCKNGKDCKNKEVCMYKHPRCPKASPEDSDAKPFKTKHCSYFLKGICSKGDDCSFIHDEKEKKKYQKTSSKKSDKESGSGSKEGTVLCKYFLSGKCHKGDKCTFLHPKASLTVKELMELSIQSSV